MKSNGSIAFTLACILILIFCSISFASDSIPDINFDIRTGVIAKDVFTTQKDALRQNVSAKLTNYVNDEASRTVFENIFKEMTVNYPDELYFEDIVTRNDTAAEIAKAFSNHLRSRLERDKGNLRSTECYDTKLDYQASLDQSDETKGSLSIKGTLSGNCHMYGPGITGGPVDLGRQFNRSSFDVVLQYAIPSSNNHIHFSMIHFETSQSFSFFKSPHIDNGRLKNIILEVADADFRHRSVNAKGKYDYLANKITDQTKSELRQRYRISEKYSLKREKRYEVDMNVAVARIQRTIINYQYDPIITMFLFSDAYTFRYADNAMVATSYRTVKLYPDEDHSVIIVYEVTYDRLIDSLLNVDVHGERQAKKDLDNLIATVSNSLETTYRKTRKR